MLISIALSNYYCKNGCELEFNLSFESFDELDYYLSRKQFESASGEGINCLDKRLASDF